MTPRLAAALEARARTSLLDWVSGTSVGRAVVFVQTRIGRAAPEPTPAELSDDEIRHIIDRYLENKRLIEAVSAAYGVTPIFVWQPVPMYHYDPQYHLFATRGFFGVTRVRRGYEAMADWRRRPSVGGHFVWLADVQKDAHEPLYVDIVHYAPPFAARLAALIDAEVGVTRGTDRARVTSLTPGGARPLPPALSLLGGAALVALVLLEIALRVCRSAIRA